MSLTFASLLNANTGAFENLFIFLNYELYVNVYAYTLKNLRSLSFLEVVEKAEWTGVRNQKLESETFSFSLFLN